jgi:uncharacterized phage-like protein YoqJ
MGKVKHKINYSQFVNKHCRAIAKIRLTTVAANDKIKTLCTKAEKEPKMKVCSFTGHRQIKYEHKKSLPNLLCRAINFAYSKGCRKFLTGGAVGFDTEAAREVIKFRISHPDVSLVLVLPYINQSERWSDGQKDAYEYTLSVADEVIYVSEEYTDTCIKKRNLHLAEEADIIIAYVARAKSGSGQTVRMAMAKGKEIYNLYPALEKNLE